jgi:hypothetical protein
LNFQEILKYFLHIYQPCAKNFSLALAVPGILPSKSPRHQPASSIRIAEKHHLSSGSLLVSTSFYYPRSATLKKGTAWPKDNEHLSEIITSK